MRSIDGVQSLPYLRELHFQRNSVPSLLSLSSNTRLIAVNGANNCINSLRDVTESLKALGDLKSVLLYVGHLMQEKATSQFLRLRDLSYRKGFVMGVRSFFTRLKHD